MTKELLGIHFKNFSKFLLSGFFLGCRKCPSIFLTLGFTFRCENSAWTWPVFFSCSLCQNECVIKLLIKEVVFSVHCVRQVDSKNWIYWKYLLMLLLCWALLLMSFPEPLDGTKRKHSGAGKAISMSSLLLASQCLPTLLSPEAWIV